MSSFWDKMLTKRLKKAPQTDFFVCPHKSGSFFWPIIVELIPFVSKYHIEVPNGKFLGDIDL